MAVATDTMANGVMEPDACGGELENDDWGLDFGCKGMRPLKCCYTSESCGHGDDVC